ncbi:outer membrane protein [Kaistia sp. MMO-174]|uniref:outer membrane protein n=1 Tax=Kaistia sp. MMO-174 TaxID=3081256 RepID=UPI001AC7F227|nr:porin family protein [Hyphomicrobiales bacterium]
MRIRLAVLALALGSLPALSADLSTPPAAEPAAFNWSGFYAGVHGGYGWAKTDGPVIAPADNPQPDGFFGGGQIGYNFQFPSQIVLGIEADAAFADLSDSSGFTDTSGFPYSMDFRTKIDAFGTVRGRLGYGMDRFLPYVTGGFAWANATYDTQFSMPDFPALSSHGSDSQTFTGWTVGAGFEYAVTSHVTAKVEYLYADLGSKDFHLGDAGPFPVDLKMQSAKLGLNYKF